MDTYAQQREAAILMSAMELPDTTLDNDDIAWHVTNVQKWSQEHCEGRSLSNDLADLHGGANVLEALQKAKTAATAEEKKLWIFRAYRKLDWHYYGLWANGVIKRADNNQMSEETKELLKANQPAPLWKNPDEQKLRESTHKWVVPGTWEQDPDKPGQTRVVISCIECGGLRTVPSFAIRQTKRCLACQSKPKKSKETE